MSGLSWGVTVTPTQIGQKTPRGCRFLPDETGPLLHALGVSVCGEWEVLKDSRCSVSRTKARDSYAALHSSILLLSSRRRQSSFVLLSGR